MVKDYPRCSAHFYHRLLVDPLIECQSENTQTTYLVLNIIPANDLIKEIQIILRLFLVIAMYCQIKSITQPPALLAGSEGSLGTCGR